MRKKCCPSRTATNCSCPTIPFIVINNIVIMIVISYIIVVVNTDNIITITIMIITVSDCVCVNLQCLQKIVFVLFFGFDCRRQPRLRLLSSEMKDHKEDPVFGLCILKNHGAEIWVSASQSYSSFNDNLGTPSGYCASLRKFEEISCC